MFIHLFNFRLFDILDNDHWISEPTPLGMIWAKRTEHTRRDKIVP